MAEVDKVEDKGTFLLELYRKALNLHQNELYEYFLDNAVKVTQSKIGFFHFVKEDQKTIVLTMWNKEALKNCTSNFSVHYSIGEAGNWADCIREKQAKIYNDFKESPNQKGLPKGHVPVSRMLTIPIMEAGNVYAIFGVGNKDLPYSDSDVVQLEVVSNELYKIMKQRLAEAEVRGEREKYRSLFENMLDGFAFCKMILDEVGKPVDFEYIEINDAFERLTGLKREAVVGKRVTEAIPGIEKDNPELFEIYGRVASTCMQERFDIYFKPLSKWFSIAVYCPQKGYFAAIFEDITHRKTAESALRESEQRWSTTLSSIGDAVIATDVLGNVTFMNKVAEDLTGWAVSDAQKRSLKEVFKIINENTRLEVESPVSRVLKESKVVGLANHTLLVQKGGKAVPIDDSGAPIKDDEGKIEGVVLVFRDVTARKKSEEELKKQAAFIALSPDAIIGKKLDDTITFWSQGAQNLYGWTPEEALGKKSRSLLKTKFPEPYEVIVKALLSWGRWSGEKIQHDKFGREIIVESRWLASCNSPCEVDEILEINVDVTERKNLENETQRLLGSVKQERDRIQSLLNSMGDEVWFADLEKKFTLANPSAIKEFKLKPTDEGVDVENLAATSEVYRPDGSVRPVEEAPPLRALLGEVVKNQEELVKTPLSGELRTRLVSSSPVRSGGGTIVGSVSVVRDITELKKAQEALKENEHLYHTVFDNSQDGFQLIELVYDEKGKPIDHKFLKVNRAYEKIIGVKAEVILDKTARFISPNVEPNWLDVPDRVAKTGISDHVELYNKDINKWLDCYYFLYSKNVVGTLFRDITVRKNLEKQLQDSERLAAIGATAGMVGHDIRNPLQAITSDLYLLKSGLDLMPQGEEKVLARESLEGIEKNVEYINKIVADLQDFARPLTPNIEETDLKIIIGDLLKKNGLPENVKVDLELESNASKFMADSSYINRIMYNLVNNAVQAMPKGGKLTIEAYKKVNDVVISVKDTGVGIPESIKGKLFTPMFTTKSKGQGFGLAVIKRMTEALGGTVTFESQEGKGTTFNIRLPPIPKSQ